MRRPPVEADPHRCGILPAPRKTTTVPKVLRVGRKGRARPMSWRSR
jgi:hypothetical protein